MRENNQFLVETFITSKITSGNCKILAYEEIVVLCFGINNKFCSLPDLHVDDIQAVL